MNYQETIEYLLEVPKFTKKNNLENTRILLEKLGNPEENTKIFHVAGTNGKGSVCAYLSSVLVESGYQVGLFTSPHLEEINERFRINGKPVSNEEFVQSFKKVMDGVKDMIKDGHAHPTFFELLFAIAMVVFRNHKTDYIILETGLGGRLDATNVITAPLAVIITAIGLDHTEYLGDTIEQIAEEKAGIIKKGIPVICDGTNGKVVDIIHKRAGLMEAPFHTIYENSVKILQIANKQVDFSVKYGYYDYVRFSLDTMALYQVRNAALAIKALEVVFENGQKKVLKEDLKNGIEKTSWPGRMEQVLPGIIVDGAHNEQGVTEIINTIKQVHNRYPVTILFSAVKEKNYKGMIESICKELNFETIVVTELTGNRKLLSSELAALFKKDTNKEIIEIKDIKEAFWKAVSLKKEKGLLFCFGSLYLVGEIKKTIRRDDHD